MVHGFQSAIHAIPEPLVVIGSIQGYQALVCMDLRKNIGCSLSHEGDAAEPLWWRMELLIESTHSICLVLVSFVYALKFAEYL